MRVLSLGAGVQSSTLLLMGIEGEVQIDRAVFADTGWEPKAVYTHLDYLTEMAEAAGIPVARVSQGNLREEALSNTHRFASMPLYVLGTDGSKGQLRRQCTKEYKVAPIRRYIRTFGATAKAPVDLLIGISLDEFQRMRDSVVKYIRHEYPLVDQRVSRGDCLAWIERHGYRVPPKSACIGCPYRRDSQWRALTEDEFSDAVEFDRQIRSLPRVDGATFLHRSMKPLEMVDFRNEQDRGQMDMFAEECEGMCGV